MAPILRAGRRRDLLMQSFDTSGQARQLVGRLGFRRNQPNVWVVLSKPATSASNGSARTETADEVPGL